MNELERFHIMAHILISLIGAVLLLAIWYNIRKRFRKILEEDDRQHRVDKGLAFISLGLLTWVALGAWTLVFHQFQSSESSFYQMGINLFSAANNVFFLLALFHFDHAPDFIFNNPTNLKRLVGGIVLLTGLSMLLILFDGNQTRIAGIQVSNLPDVAISGFLSYLLIVSLYRTFQHRGMQLISFLSVLIIVLMFISQLPTLFPVMNDIFVNSLVKIVAKTSLISIFLVVATTWVIQLAHTPVPDEMAISFHDWSLIRITIPSKRILNQRIDFGSKTTQFRNLLKFALRRKMGKGMTQCMEVGAAGELKSQTYLTRIIDNLNEIMNLEEENKLERKDLFTFLGQGKYRLRVLPENILMDEALISEFVREDGQNIYKDLLSSH